MGCSEIPSIQVAISDDEQLKQTNVSINVSYKHKTMRLLASFYWTNIARRTVEEYMENGNKTTRPTFRRTMNFSKVESRLNLFFCILLYQNTLHVVY